MQVDSSVLDILNRSATMMNALTLPGGLDRKTYLKVNEVLEAAGGKWDRKKKAHVFASAAAEAISKVTGTGEIETDKELGYFPTPPDLVQRLMLLARIEPGMEVLEPSAGEGAIALAVDEITPYLTCVEMNNGRATKLRGLGFDVIEDDFLNVAMTPRFDRIVMNPPFSKQQDIDHVTHAYGMLAPGGRLVTIMSSSVKFRDNKKTKTFLDLVHDNSGGIYELPADSFKESGTSVNTVMVTMFA